MVDAGFPPSQGVGDEGSKRDPLERERARERRENRVEPPRGPSRLEITPILKSLEDSSRTNRVQAPRRVASQDWPKMDGA